MDSPIPAKIAAIATSCVVRIGYERKEVFRSADVAETRADVVSGLHGMGEFRIDYMNDHWIIHQEFLSVDVDIERVTAPPAEPPAESPVEPHATESHTAEPRIAEPHDAQPDESHTACAPSCLISPTADDPMGYRSPTFSLPPEKLALLMDEISAIDTRINDVKQALELYRESAVIVVEKKFGVGRDRPSNAPKACFEMLQECVAAFPEMYAYLPPTGIPPSDIADEPASAQQQAYPRLREHLRSRSLVIVGGLPIPQRMDWVENALGVRPEWLETTPNGHASSLVMAVDHRMRDDKIGAIIIAHDLIRHNTFYQLRNSAATRRVPLAFASKCGNGQLSVALGQLERILRQRAAENVTPAR